MEATTEMVAFRLEPIVRQTLEAMAKKDGIEVSAYMQRLLRLHAANSELMAPADRDRIVTSERLLNIAVRTACELEAAGHFDQHFTLTVIRKLFTDPTYRSDYEKVVGGDAYRSGLPGKASFNMSLGWQIKAAVGADPILDDKGKPRRAQIREEPIKSYTLLTMPPRTDAQ